MFFLAKYPIYFNWTLIFYFTHNNDFTQIYSIPEHWFGMLLLNYIKSLMVNYFVTNQRSSVLSEEIQCLFFVLCNRVSKYMFWGIFTCSRGWGQHKNFIFIFLKESYSSYSLIQQVGVVDNIFKALLYIVHQFLTSQKFKFWEV